MKTENAEIIALACRALQESGAAEARHLIQSQYPFEPRPRSPRTYTTREKLETFYRDGFIDRYTGQQLVCPGVLFVLSAELGQETFPYHPNWKMDECHIAYWHLYPTIDHIVPIAVGGTNDPSNWITTSQLTNSSKANFAVEELGWEVLPPGNLAEWDGLIEWFLEYAETNPSLEGDSRIAEWLMEARRIVG